MPLPTPGMLETTSKVTPQPGNVLLVDILLKKFWAKPCLNKRKQILRDRYEKLLFLKKVSKHQKHMEQLYVKLN